MSTAPLFLVDSDQLDASTLYLRGAERHHAAQVRRLRVGEQLVIGDGAGRTAVCTVDSVDRAGITCAVRDRRDDPRPEPALAVVQALPKGDRGQRAVELLTEVGADAIVPWAAQRCVTQWREGRAEKGAQRWRTAAREAAKQSRRAWLPEVRELASTEAVCRLVARAACAVVLHESAARPLADVDVPPTGEVVVVVGPEGGLPEAELAALVSAGAEAVRLGPTVLRTSTAGVVACAVLLSRTARWAAPGAQ